MIPLRFPIAVLMVGIVTAAAGVSCRTTATATAPTAPMNEAPKKPVPNTTTPAAPEEPTTSVARDAKPHGEPVPAKPAQDKPVPVKPVPAKPAQDKPVPAKPAQEKPVPVKPAPAEPVTEKPVQDKTAGSASDRIDKHAFPPTISDSSWHQDAWLQRDCLRCHETGVQGATVVRHEDQSKILLTAKCRTCHVFIPGSKPRPIVEVESRFAKNAFPPMIPASASHTAAWWKDDCLLCHEDGLRGAPVPVHEGMPKILLTAKCRTCHVQVRAATADKLAGRGH